MTLSRLGNYSQIIPYMYYTSSDIQQMAGLMHAKLQEMIKAKKDIQNALFIQATSSEAMSLAMNTVPQSLVTKLKTIGKQYLNKTSKKDVDIMCVAMAVGTILKELDNGNTSYVTNSAIASLMNELQ